MTGDDELMRKKTSNKTSSVFLSATATLSILVGAAIAVANDESPVVRHIFDSSTDRVPLLTAFPKYPSVARRDRIEGEATVCFKIKTNGKISRPSIRESTHKIFVRPTMRAIKKSTFEPLGPSQVLATSKTCRTYRFRLEPLVVKTESS
jgi:TonB family protein